MIEYKVKVEDNGTRWWYLNGKLHRVDGPAVECADGSSSWWLNGNLHRVDGPAVEWHTGSRQWFLNDVEYTEEDFNKKTKATELTLAEIGSLLGYPVKVVK